MLYHERASEPLGIGLHHLVQPILGFFRVWTDKENRAVILDGRFHARGSFLSTALMCLSSSARFSRMNAVRFLRAVLHVLYSVSSLSTHSLRSSSFTLSPPLSTADTHSPRASGARRR